MREQLQKFLAVKTIFYIIAFGVLAYGIFFRKHNPSLDNNNPSYQSWMNTICFEKNCFDIEIADTPTKRELWLMNRTSMETNRWMLFVFEQEQISSFWMKNTKIPLDIVWLDKKGQIIDIQTGTPCKEDPCPLYTPSGSGLYVLELNAWVSQLIGLQTWTIAKFTKK